MQRSKYQSAPSFVEAFPMYPAMYTICTPEFGLLLLNVKKKYSNFPGLDMVGLLNQIIPNLNKINVQMLCNFFYNYFKFIVEGLQSNWYSREEFGIKKNHRCGTVYNQYCFYMHHVIMNTNGIVGAHVLNWSVFSGSHHKI